jgi:hypothetical protein
MITCEMIDLVFLLPGRTVSTDRLSGHIMSRGKGLGGALWWSSVNMSAVNQLTSSRLGEVISCAVVLGWSLDCD